MGKGVDPLGVDAEELGRGREGHGSAVEDGAAVGRELRDDEPYRAASACAEVAPLGQEGEVAVAREWAGVGEDDRAGRPGRERALLC